MKLINMKLQFFKRIVNGITTELHLQQNSEKSVITKVFPELPKEGMNYRDEEIKEIENLEKWKKEGIESGVFTISSFEPTQS